MSDKSFESVDALRRIGDSELVRYHCFPVLPDNKYWVQSCERFRLPLTEQEKRDITEQSVDVLRLVPFGVGDESRAVFGEMYDSLDEAIMAFEENYCQQPNNSSGQFDS